MIPNWPLYPLDIAIERMEFRVFIDELAAWVAQIAYDQWIGLERR
jgi:hypothetical protein